VPILACTANAMSSEAARCAAAGMDGCLLKPVELLELLEHLEQWLPLPAKPEARPALLPPSAGAEDLPFDPGVLQVISEGDAGIERQVITDFLRANAADLHGLREAAEVGDLPEAGRLAHRVMGAAQTLGARALLQACRDVEARAQAGDVTGTRTALAAVAAESAVLEHAFRARLRMVDA
jgi:two-component system sensor histidine kinase EvgS